jgi:hypothetical protein
VARCRASASAVAVLFLVETGAYINAIRMDILATALAHRHGMPKPEDVYFPVASRGSCKSAVRNAIARRRLHRNLRLMGTLLSVR